MAKTPDEKINKLKELVESGYSVSIIAEKLDIGKTTVRDNIKKLGLTYKYDHKEIQTLQRSIKSSKYLQSLKTYDIEYTGTLRLNEDQIKFIFNELLTVKIDLNDADDVKVGLIMCKELGLEDILSIMVSRKMIHPEDLFMIESIEGVDINEPIK